nr:hypothetical protein [uncultured Tyzzerella sp.]
MEKILKKIYKTEKRICSALGIKITYLLIFLSTIGFYFLGYIIGKIIF